MALDPMMAAFESEMRDKARRRPRPAATRRAELIDNSSAPGAAELGRRIQAFWADVGVDITVEVIHAGGPRESPVFAVRSDMIGGLPAGAKGGRPQKFRSGFCGRSCRHSGWLRTCRKKSLMKSSANRLI
jgi:hypothetical protein